MAWSKTGLHFPEKKKTMFSDKAPRKSCLSLQHFHSPSPDCSPAAMKRISGFFGDWDGLLYDGKSGLFWTKYQNVFMNNHIKVHDSCIKMPSIWILSVFDHDHYIYRMERKCWYPCDVIFTPSCLLGIMQLDHRKGHGENVNRAWLSMACQMLQCYDVTPADLQTSK